MSITLSKSVEIDIDYADVIDFIDSCYESEKDDIINYCLEIKSMQDKMKLDLLIESIKKYTLTELEERLK